MAHKKYALIVIETGVCVYGKRNVLLPTINHVLPVQGMDHRLEWFEMEFSDYPEIDIETQGVTYKEELIDNKFKVTYLAFNIEDGNTMPITIARGRAPE